MSSMALKKSRSRPGSKNRVWIAAIFVCALIVAVYVFPFARQPTFHSVHPARVAVDMHTHTTESDGDFTAEEVIEFAKSRGLSAVWITDHDMIRSMERTRSLLRDAALAGITLGFGVEITVGWEGKEHHLLGYFPDAMWRGVSLSPEMQALQVAVAKVKKSREDRNDAMVAWLNEILWDPERRSVYFTSAANERSFSPLNAGTVGEWAREHAALTEVTSLGRPHFRKYLVQVCGVRDDLIFGPRSGNGEGVVLGDGSVVWDAEAEGRPGTQVEALLHSATLARRNIAFRPMPIKEAISMIAAAGGKSVVAHLPTLGKKWKTKFLPLLGDLAQAGLWGVEAYSAEISEDDHTEISAAAEKHGLHATGGSDSHGTLKPYAHIGDVWRSRLSFGRQGSEARHDAPAPSYPATNGWRKHGVAASSALRGGHHA